MSKDELERQLKKLQVEIIHIKGELHALKQYIEPKPKCHYCGSNDMITFYNSDGGYEDVFNDCGKRIVGL